jgi:hypothetical protein
MSEYRGSGVGVVRCVLCGEPVREHEIGPCPSIPHGVREGVG